MSGLLEIDSLTSGYGQIRAIEEATLTVETGKVVVVLGPNGAGKTTLLNAVAGLTPTFGGSVALSGTSLDRLASFRRSRAGIGLVQENKRVFRGMTVQENLQVSGPRNRRRSTDLLAGVLERFPDLGSRMGDPAGSLSGGQQQMLAIGQALMGQPKVLLLDEPSAGLAPRLVREVMDSVVAIASTGVGVLLVEQTVHEALRIADRVYVLSLGRCVEQPNFRSAAQAELLERLYLGEGNAAPPIRNTQEDEAHDVHVHDA